MYIYIYMCVCMCMYRLVFMINEINHYQLEFIYICVSKLCISIHNQILKLMVME
jgi:hypothetical protein